MNLMKPFWQNLWSTYGSLIKTFGAFGLIAHRLEANKVKLICMFYVIFYLNSKSQPKVDDQTVWIKTLKNNRTNKCDQIDEACWRDSVAKSSAAKFKLQISFDAFQKALRSLFVAVLQGTSETQTGSYCADLSGHLTLNHL